METNNKDSIILNDVLPVYAVHPGSILVEELKERGIKQKDFAKSIGMEAPHLSALIHGKRNITPAIASRLESGLGIPASIWLNLQNQYNLHKGQEVKRRIPFIVDGYAGMHGSLASLREPAPIGVGTEVKIILPESDLPLLFSLANRMGWGIVN